MEKRIQLYIGSRECARGLPHLDKLHRSVVNVHKLNLNFGMICGHLVGDFSPQPAKPISVLCWPESQISAAADSQLSQLHCLYWRWRATNHAPAGIKDIRFVNYGELPTTLLRCLKRKLKRSPDLASSVRAHVFRCVTVCRVLSEINATCGYNTDI